MIATAKPKHATQEPIWTDERLVRECLQGNQVAWSALIDKYKNLIYSIPVKYEIARDDANDIFQGVCVDLYAELSRLREPRALPKWLIQTTVHKCIRYKQQTHLSDEEVSEAVAGTAHGADVLIEEVQQEQALRNAIAAVPARCGEMIRMLFFELPARPYEQIAKQLGLATGSIGFIRSRCLDKLRKQLELAGFRRSHR